MVGITAFLLLGVTIGSFPLQQKANAAKAYSVQDTTFTFRRIILPILKNNCMPCHFPGGTVYERYPFEEYKTVFALRKRLHTRLKLGALDTVNIWIASGAVEK
ncbi:MAG: hypothetical protein HY276_06455 [Ignavibacteriales bacterium]|nr:hypothetical protein [Ignavibacteriales bacterium]